MNSILMKRWCQAITSRSFLPRLVGISSIGLSIMISGVLLAGAETSSFVPLKAADAPERGSSLLDQQVEISGNFYSPITINPKSNFSRGKISDPSVDPRAMNSKATVVVFDLVDKNTIVWMAKNMCREIC